MFIPAAFDVHNEQKTPASYLVLGALSLQGPPWLLLVLSGLVPREARGFEGRTPHRQAVLVLLKLQLLLV